MGFGAGEKRNSGADQIWEWLYRKRVQSFEEMTNLSKDLIAKLNDQFVVNPLKQRIVQESADGQLNIFWIARWNADWDSTHASTLWFICLCDHSGRL